MKSTLLGFSPRRRFLFWCNGGATGKINDFRKMAIIVKCIKAKTFQVWFLAPENKKMPLGVQHFLKLLGC
jgi:hypothetical protein